MKTPISKELLFKFLNGSNEVFEVDGLPTMTRDNVRDLLCEMIEPTIEVKDICELDVSVVAAAPHVSFDGWTEYYCNRTAHLLKTGRVIARHFRDDNEHDIPASIGRHVHVNRPTESNDARGHEHETARAHEVFKSYVNALRESGKGKLPLDLLIEFHGHHSSEDIEIATIEFEEKFAVEVLKHYRQLIQRDLNLPELLIEPLHQLRYRAQAAKQHGSLRPEIARKALHIELPRSLRQTDVERQMGWDAIHSLLSFVIGHIDTND